AVAGKLKVANFIGQWVPSLLILATFDRLMHAEVGVAAPVSAGALPNGVAATRPGAGSGTTTGPTRTPGLELADAGEAIRTSWGRNRNEVFGTSRGPSPGPGRRHTPRSGHRSPLADEGSGWAYGAPGNEVFGTARPAHRAARTARASGNEVFGTGNGT